MMLKSLAGQYRSRQSLHLSLVLSKLRMLATKKPDTRGGVYVLASSPMAVHARLATMALSLPAKHLRSCRVVALSSLSIAGRRQASRMVREG